MIRRVIQFPVVGIIIIIIESYRHGPCLMLRVKKVPANVSKGYI